MKNIGSSKKRSRVQGRNFRWVVPRLDPQVWTRKEAYKAEVLDRLLASKTARKGVRHYSVAVESHADGSPHLDLLLVFEKTVELRPTELDFLCGKHGDLTRYRNLNAAILAYGSKEDVPLSDASLKSALQIQAIKHNPYAFLQQRMLRDPFGFNLDQYCAQNNYFAEIRGYSTIRSKLRTHQEAACNLILKKKPGLREITPCFIRAVLSDAEFQIFQSWVGYCTIVGFINEIFKYGPDRPFKSKQLLLVGPPNVGKTSLVNEISRHVATYEMGVSNWFPRYCSGVYSLISWNEFRLSAMPYANLLRFLEGTPMDLQYKGGSTLKKDNPLMIASSNLTYSEHLFKKFNAYSKLPQLRAALQNLPARLTQLQIPTGFDLFILIKLVREAAVK